jgi:hypothetical protein
MVILGISIGTRTSGIAIISRNGLIEWRTLSFKNSWSEKKADYIIRTYERYIKRHKVTVVSLKVPPLTHQTKAITDILEKLVALFTYHGCMVEYKTKVQIKEAIPDLRNSKDIINYSATLYPVLVQKQQRELRNRNKYHDKMFEAVLVAHLCKQETSYPPD